jgi:hypothetical protein
MRAATKEAGLRAPVNPATGAQGQGYFDHLGSADNFRSLSVSASFATAERECHQLLQRMPNSLE